MNAQLKADCRKAAAQIKENMQPFDWLAWYKSLGKIEYTVSAPSATERQYADEVKAEIEISGER